MCKCKVTHTSRVWIHIFFLFLLVTSLWEFTLNKPQYNSAELENKLKESPFQLNKSRTTKREKTQFRLKSYIIQHANKRTKKLYPAFFSAASFSVLSSQRALSFLASLSCCHHQCASCFFQLASSRLVVHLCAPASELRHCLSWLIWHRVCAKLRLSPNFSLFLTSSIDKLMFYWNIKATKSDFSFSPFKVAMDLGSFAVHSCCHYILVIVYHVNGDMVHNRVSRTTVKGRRMQELWFNG